ncbi:MAG: UvrD-helicase domain-containing protein [Smithella sp.]|nr:UvrD-helicase domain-containing protein [Smithella sp.]
MESILLQASAGSGKTTSLTQEVFKRISTGAKFVCALTFTRAATTEMRTRIMKEIAENKELPLLKRLKLIMQAGRVGYTTIDAFFYRLFIAAGKVAQLADEKRQMQLLGSIEAMFRDRIIHEGNADRVIVAAKILGTDIDALFAPLARDEDALRFDANSSRVFDLGALMAENALLQNTLAALYDRAQALAQEVTAAVKSRVIGCMSDYDNFISKVVAKQENLEGYVSLGKNIKWDEAPYTQLNDIFLSYRKNAERLAVNKALLRELAVSSLYPLYREAADAVKSREGFIFFSDVRKALLELDTGIGRERPGLMGQYFSLGLDRTEHLLIDEFQDTSKSDVAILLPLIDEILSGPGERGGRSFFAVGDWKQMIYGWRGADREALEAAIGPYIEDGTIRESSLEYNYRSTPLLISFFNALVENLFEGKEKNEKQRPPEKPAGFDGPTEVNLYELEKDGASQEPFYTAMAAYISAKKEEYACPWGDMAVLSLTNNHAQKIEEALRGCGIGVSTVKGRQLLSTREGASVMIFLGCVLDVEKPSDYLSAAASSELISALGIGMDEARAEFAVKYPRPFGLMPVTAAIELLRGKISAAVLDIWLEEAHSFFNGGGYDADEFLAAMFSARLNISVPEAPHGDCIKVDTIHGTKGLQFRHVFVFWNEDDTAEPFYLESEQCHVRFSTKEIEFLQAGGSPAAREIISRHEESRARARREQANLLYVAVTRAAQSLSVFLPKKKSGTYKPAHQALIDTFAGFAPSGSRREESTAPGDEKRQNEVTLLDAAPVRSDEPEPYAEIDPALLSESIRSGIVRGERIHRWLAGVGAAGELPPRGELGAEEYEAVLRFVHKSEVREVIFRPGRVYTEQQISDRESFGIVDRMIVSDNLVTIIDYKSGSMRGLRKKYEEQLARYRDIVRALYPAAQVEYHILAIDV